ncbi:hypothetical protein BDZ91DRAFT_742204 [Kalaharituber pfeilii]|nr:hypothetical protein BDZ91DRAFT_742204 [Kalaharituber pfeilii]
MPTFNRSLIHIFSYFRTKLLFLWALFLLGVKAQVLIGARSCPRLIITNAFTSLISHLSLLRRGLKIYQLLLRGDWFLHSGWENGKTRTDVVLICWRENSDLRKLALQVAVQIETVGGEWEILVLGRKLQQANSGIQAHARWFQSPRCVSFCAARTSENSEPHFPVDAATIAQAVMRLQMRESPDAIGDFLYNARDKRPSRCAYFAEVRAELKDEVTPARHITSFAQVGGELPFASNNLRTGAYGNCREVALRCSPFMYAALHMTITVAVGLMGAASGRGLAIWLIILRPALTSMGMTLFKVADLNLFLLSFNEAVLSYETGQGSPHVAGDMDVYGLPAWRILYSFALNVVELVIVIGGWAYGALRAEKSKPTGLVGHGMLALTVLVGIVLSLRALGGIRKRLLGRLVGTFQTQDYVRYILGTSVAIPMELVRRSLSISEDIRLVDTLLQECRNDKIAITSATDVLRYPSSATSITQHVVTNMIKYHYDGDSILCKGDPPITVSTWTEYTWRSAALCNLLTVACACVSICYAYLQFPNWVKLIVEVTLALSATGYATLERLSNLQHNRDTYLSHMVATMVVSAVWYVGVKDLG